MSKVDAMQAMREARYAARAANPTRTVPNPAATAPRTKTPMAQVPPAAGDDVPSVAVPGEPEQEALCGHRSMNNRLCRRPAGHSEKNHRYS